MKLRTAVTLMLGIATLAPLVASPRSITNPLLPSGPNMPAGSRHAR